MMMKKSVAALACLLPLLLASSVFGQTTGFVKGVVVGPDGQPLPGVMVEGKSSALQGSRTARTDKEGRFSLSLLPPGIYTVTVTLEGLSAKPQTVKLGLDQEISLRFELTPVRTETVTVSAEAAPIDITSNTVGRNLDSKLFQALPTARDYSSVVQLNPGIGTDPSDDRNTAITVYGSTGLENAYLVDGANTTGVEVGSQGKSLPFEFVQEAEFKSGGYEAEYGHAMGGILNAVTKSGGNEFHGDVFGYFNQNGLQANNKHLAEITAGGVPQGFTKEDFGLDIGGYLLKDKLWFFGAYDRVHNSQDTLVTTPPVAGIKTNVTTTRNLYSGKLTWRLDDHNSIIGTVFGDPTTDTGAVADSIIGPPTTYEGTNTVGGTDFSARYEGIFGSSWLATAQYARHHESLSLEPGPGGDTIPYLDQTGAIVTATGGFIGIGQNGQFATKKFTRDGYRADGTYFFGGHDVKVGGEYEKIKADVIRYFSGGQLVGITSDPNYSQNIYSHVFFASVDSTLANPVSAPLVATPNHQIYSAFVQDSWKALSNLTVNAGVRWEKQKINGLGNVTFIDIDHFSPRVGFSWDFLKDGKTKFFASYGQFVDAIPMDMNIRSLNGERDATTFNFDPVSLVPDPALANAYPSAIKGTAVNDIAPNLRTEYQEEIVVGIDRQVGNDWSFGLHGIYRSLRNVIEDTYITSDSNYGFFNPGISTQACLAGVCQTLFPYPPARRYFRGIEVIAQKRLADRWMLYASYLYSQLKGNFDGGYREIGGFNAKDPNITDDFDYPEFVVNSDGRLTLDRPHQVKIQGVYVFPFNLTASLAGFYMSGTPLSRIGWWDGYQGPEIFLTQRGSEGRSPSLYEIDGHLDYGLAIGPAVVHVLVDVFNLLNRQQPATIDQVWDFAQNDNSSPVPINSHYGLANSWQQPRTLRLGLRVSF